MKYKYIYIYIYIYMDICIHLFIAYVWVTSKITFYLLQDGYSIAALSMQNMTSASVVSVLRYVSTWEVPKIRSPIVEPKYQGLKYAHKKEPQFMETARCVSCRSRFSCCLTEFLCSVQEREEPLSSHLSFVFFPHDAAITPRTQTFLVTYAAVVYFHGLWAFVTCNSPITMLNILIVPPSQNPERIQQVELQIMDSKTPYGVDYGTLRWIYALDLGCGLSGSSNQVAHPSGSPQVPETAVWASTTTHANGGIVLL